MRLIKPFLVLLALQVSLSAIEVDDRNNTEAEDIATGSKPSTIPTGGLIKDLKDKTITVFKDADVSEHLNKKVYVGYGVYDMKQENCAKTELASSDGSSITSVFEKNSAFVFNGHAYLLSYSNMTLDQCNAAAINYHGYPIQVTSTAENNAISNAFLGNKYWVGTKRADKDSLYYDSKGEEQKYFNEPYDAAMDETKHGFRSSVGIWIKTATTDAYKCAIEFDTDDYEKPLKVCAPWWTIERTYPLPSSGQYLVRSVDSEGNAVDIDIRSFNQADFPKKAKVCTQRQAEQYDAAGNPLDSEGNPIDVNATQTVVCSSFYDISKSPRCELDIHQEVCFVDQCRLGIKNSCTLTNTEDAPLTYSKKLVYDDLGNEVWIKDREDIKMHSYECNIYHSTTPCLKQESVMMLPQPCPGTHVDANDSSSAPIRVYGNPSKPPILDGSGNVVALVGECPDGTTIDVPVDVISRNSKTCKEYSWAEVNKNWSQMCSQARPYTDYGFLTYIGETDTKEADPLCVRLNNLQESQPDQEINVEYKRSGYAGVNLVKAYLEGTTSDLSPIPVVTNYLQKIEADGEHTETGGAVVTQTPDIDMSLVPQTDCSGQNERATFVGEIWQGYDDNFGAKRTSRYPTGRLIDFGVMPLLECLSKVSISSGQLIEGAPEGNATVAAEYDLNYEALYELSDLGISSADMIRTADPETNSTTVKNCVVSMPLLTNDDFDDVAINAGNSYQTETVGQYSFFDCRNIALCMSGDYLNVKDYTGSEICKLSFGAAAGDATAQEFQDEQYAAIEAQLPPEEAVVHLTPTQLAARMGDSEWRSIPLQSINGASDIFTIQEWTEGGSFGYFPSYTFALYESSQVKINDRFVWPIIPHPKSTETLTEDSYWWNKRWFWKAANGGQAWMNSQAFVADGGGYHDSAESYISQALTGAGGGSTLITGIYILFNGNNEGFNAVIKLRAHAGLATIPRFTPNFYPQFEMRHVVDNDITYAEFGQWTYGAESGPVEGRIQSDPGDDDVKWFRTLTNIATDAYNNLNVYNPAPTGYDMPSFVRGLVGTPADKPSGWDKLNPWYHDEKISSGVSTRPLKRYVTTNYMQAVNGLTIVVPYQGDYVLEAYTKSGQKISDMNITADQFIERPVAGNSAMNAVQVYFGQNMPLAPGIEEGVIDNACRSATMVSMGGGMAGSYYEMGGNLDGEAMVNGGSGTYEGCQQANHLYVEDNAITQIKIKPKGADTFFVVDLKYPLPYPNRVFVSTLGEKIVKDYRCFDEEFPECADYEKTN